MKQWTNWCTTFMCVVFQVCSRGLQVRVRTAVHGHPLQSVPKRCDAWRMCTIPHQGRTVLRGNLTTGRKLSLRGRLLHVPGAQEVGRVRDLALTRASVYPFLVPSMNKRNGPKYQRLWRPSALGLSENLYSWASWRRSSRTAWVSADVPLSGCAYLGYRPVVPLSRLVWTPVLPPGCFFGWVRRSLLPDECCCVWVEAGYVGFSVAWVFRKRKGMGINRLLSWTPRLLNNVRPCVTCVLEIDVPNCWLVCPIVSRTRVL